MGKLLDLHVHVHCDPCGDGVLEQDVKVIEAQVDRIADRVDHLVDLVERTPQIVFHIGPVAEQR